MPVLLLVIKVKQWVLDCGASHYLLVPLLILLLVMIINATQLIYRETVALDNASLSQTFGLCYTAIGFVAAADVYLYQTLARCYADNGFIDVAGGLATEDDIATKVKRTEVITRTLAANSG